MVNQIIIIIIMNKIMDEKNNNIERRNFNTSEIRIDQKSESREVVGYASVFNSRSENLGGFYEVISENAFNSVLEDTENLDCRCLFNHNPDLILGRTTSGTLSLSVDENGLQYRFNMPDTSFGNDLMVSLKRGDVNQSSFGFIVEEDDWDEDENGMTIRTIKKVGRLLDVSPVTYPAYPEATVGKRSFLNYRTQKEKRETEREQKYQIKSELLNKKIKLIKLKK